MNIEEWTDGLKVTAFPWIDGKYIYFNVQAFKSGGNINKPISDKSVLIRNDDNAQHVLNNYLNTLANAVLQMKRTGTDVIVTAPKML